MPTAFDPKLKICPLLSAGLVTIPKPTIVDPNAPNGNAQKAVPCQGNGCAIFVEVADDNGAVIGGYCAISAQVQATTANGEALATLASASSAHFRNVRDLIDKVITLVDTAKNSVGTVLSNLTGVLPILASIGMSTQTPSAEAKPDGKAP